MAFFICVWARGDIHGLGFRVDLFLSVSTYIKLVRV